MKFCRAYLAFLFILFPVILYGADVQEYTLRNGLKVLIVEEHKAPVATFQIWYRVGSRDEPAGKSGLSHLLEHMMFKGTALYGPSVLSKIVQKNGGTDNAYTTKDYTVYFELFASDRITLAIDLEADRMQNLLLEKQEVISERKVVMEERRLRYEDDPQNSLFEEVVAAAFKVHPYQRPVIGWMSDLQSIERDDLLHYYKTYYAPQNAVIVVVGDVNAKDMMERIRSSFEDRASDTSIRGIPYGEPEQRGEKRLFLKKEAELPFIITAYHVPSFPHEDSYALDVLHLVLSGGKSSRLYQSLVYEKKVALSASADFSGFNRDPYLFFFFATASPGKHINDVEDALHEEIEKLRKSPPSEREIQKAINQIESSFVMGQDSIYVQAMQYGMFEMLGDWRLMDKYLAGVRKVTQEDVVRVAEKYLREENRTVGILIPTKQEKSEL
ncbi:MAG: putative Zn-dependent protease, involved in pqq synthesis (ppqF) [Nitrospirae bacterium]|nr:putative Zn-dependent protease, involved in pqq synthesis (ppqF) [Nitrospirota bacterium]